MGWGTYAGELAVNIFFVVSGFMIAGSYLRRRHLADFLWARVIRIYPAYVFCLLGTAFVLGAVYTVLPLGAYYSNHEVVRYVAKNFQLGPGLVWTLPGVFAQNPGMDVVNGSIWTLPAEIRMYLWVAFAGVTGILIRRGWCNVLVLLLVACGLFFPAHIPLVPLKSYLGLAGYFAFGVFCYVNRSHVPVGWSWVICFGLMAWLLRATPVYSFAFALALSAFAFAFAYATPGGRFFNRFGDYSYGLYLWGFPIQQVIAHHAPNVGPLQNALAAWPIAMLLAVFSWHAVEKPSLKLKQLPSKLYMKLRLLAGAEQRML
ncbi:acyltransferase [Dyella jejuensis]